MRLVHTSYAIKDIYLSVWSGHIVFTNNEQGTKQMNKHREFMQAYDSATAYQSASDKGFQVEHIRDYYISKMREL